MEQVVCLLCGASDEQSLLRREKPRHVVCRRCGLVYQNPRPTLAELLAYYEKDYWEGRGQIATAVDAPRSANSLARAKAIVDWNRSFVRPDDLVVEVGCGHGEILSLVRDELGCRALGIEPSRAQSAAAVARFGLEMITAGVEDADLGGRQARLLVLSHVVEHFIEPRAELSRCRNLLADGGRIFVEVPNILHPHPRKRLSRWLMFEHMYYYSVGTLGQLLDQAGYQVLRTESDTYVRILAEKLPAPRGQAGKSPNEFHQVKRALMWHELVYWPRYVAGRLLGPLGRRPAAPADDE